jgi:hypothetical protein
MSALRYWFAANEHGEALVLATKQSADDYRAQGGWVQGPFVELVDYQAAVEHDVRGMDSTQIAQALADRLRQERDAA